MKKKVFVCMFLILLFFAISQSLEARRKPVVVPHNDGYTLVHGAYLRPIHGYYSIHPIVQQPDILSYVIHLPIWNGVFWAYKYSLTPMVPNNGPF